MGITDLVDTSNQSMVYSLCVFVLVWLSLNYFYEDIAIYLSDKLEQDNYFETKIKAILFSTTAIITFVVMIFYRRYLIHAGSQVYADEPYDT